MFTRRLGRSNLEVSAMGLGCWAIGGPWTFENDPEGWGQIDDAESIRAIHYALDAGINFFDTAANYGCGHSERILARALAGKRDQVTIATKFGFNVNEVEKQVTLHQDDPLLHVRAECEASLRRLNTDVIDLYQLHVWDYPLEKVPAMIQLLESLVSEGKIRYYGWSTDNPERAQVFAQGAHCTSIQHNLHMVYDAPQMLAVCQEYDQASINRSPLGRGTLTGKFNRDTTFPEDDVRHAWDMQAEQLTQHLQRIEAVRNLFAEVGEVRTPAQIALAWIWTRSERTIPIPGFKTVAQVAENIRAMDFGLLSSEQMKKIDEIFERSSIRA
ncbi:pyridoxine 4-dehydrogenase [Thermoflexales bacterium]|nr:pyridoxine 4-dehydrogenase [Thermoflexales bacterium]